jgi:hypothetical protein
LDLGFLPAAALELDAEVERGVVHPLFQVALVKDLSSDAVRRAEEIADLGRRLPWPHQFNAPPAFVVRWRIEDREQRTGDRDQKRPSSDPGGVRHF